MKIDKDRLLKDLAHFVLQNGLANASLRPMAKAVGTSDRMLIYHFGNKERLLAEVLTFIAADMAQMLTGMMEERRFENDDTLLQTICLATRQDIFLPYRRLWFDILSASNHESTAFEETGQDILNMFYEWLEPRLPAQSMGAARMLAIVEGVFVLDHLGQTEISNRAIFGETKSHP